MDIQQLVFNTFINYSITLTPIIIALIISGQFKLNLTTTRNCILGVALAIAAVISAFSPLQVAEGVVLDFKHVLTALSAFLGGPLSGLITLTAALVVRFIAGGGGMWAGLVSILFCGIAGYLFRHLYFNKMKTLNLNIFILFLGMTAASVEIMSGFINFLFIPPDVMIALLKNHIVPIYISNTLAMISFGAVIAIIESRRRYQEELLQSEHRYAELINMAPDGIAGIQNGKIFFVNNAAAAILQFSKEELIGRTALFLIAPEYRGEIIKMVRKHIKQKERPSLLESKVLSRNKTPHDVEFSIGLIEHNGLPAIIAFARNISKRKHSEDERIKLEQHLRQSQKMEAVGRLAGGIAHDFNNLLQIILGYLDILIDKNQSSSPAIPPDPELYEIEQAANRAADLTQQLLAFSRKQVMQQTNLNLNDVIQGMIKLITRVIGEHIDLVFHPGDDLGTVCVDKNQCEQVLMNLCVNARDAMCPQEADC
ncbi:MAG: PAS domain S-box protein [Spirochaetales bacterium]|nr:PAS domain S-box protein [Spirochaetales bacterium]